MAEFKANTMKKSAPGSKGGLNQEIQARIGHQLRAMYDDVVRQGVPDRFAELIKRLDEPQQGEAAAVDSERRD
ncbi:NepR family anti-sigma factor [Rhodopseudomonas telluris]|uniref:NepR family anti-sigma factor n=1 Tax=Rhodopseudomonas telluris TaxID=644215 RepID=A0ABV6EMX3_9BRAD